MKDRVAVLRRFGVLIVTFVIAALAGLRVTLALHDDTPEPAWGIALIVAGFLQLGTGVWGLRRDAPWRRSAALVQELALPFTVARPLLGLLG